MNSGVKGTQWVACEWKGGREGGGRIEGGRRVEGRKERTEEGGTKAER